MARLHIKKISIDSLSLDGLEHRPDIARNCRLMALFLLAASFAFDLILVMDFSRPYQIAQFSQDEYWFLEEIAHLQNLLLAGDFMGIRDFGSPFAYGFPFWLFSAVVAMPLHGHIMLMALFLRLIFMAMKYGAFYIVYRRTLDLTRKPLFSFLVLMLMLAVPAFVFDGKIISPEYLIMLLVAVGWDSLFAFTSNAQMRAAFCFALAIAIKINTAPLALLFPAVWIAHDKRERIRDIANWIFGAILPVLLFLFPAQPFKEILAINATHHVDYGLIYLSVWYDYNALEFDEMLKGGWVVDFIAWPLFLILFGTAMYRDLKYRDTAAKMWPRYVLPTIVWTFYAAVFACFLNSLNSLMHPWFVFAPFMLLIAGGCLLIAPGRWGTTAMLVFLIVYVGLFGGRYLARWEHRIDKFENVAATENADADVATWIAGNCPKARQAVIDYSLLWPAVYNGRMQRSWTLIEVEDYRRHYGDATILLNDIDILLLKRARVDVLFPPGLTNRVNVPAGVLGNFFTGGPPYFVRVHDFSHLSVFAREGVCKK